MKCTWKDCAAEATNPQTSQSGQIWANLCHHHHQLLDEEIAKKEFNPKRIMAMWIAAQGGAKKAAARALGE